MNKVVKLKPVIKSYIWGGNYFQKYNKGNLDIISELWELSVREDDSSFIYGSDKRLFDVITKEDLGPNCSRFPYFPILIKLIDAKDDLSIQVHPSDEYALKYENSFGKSEMWYILDADEDAGLYIGLNDNYSKETIKEKLLDNTILDALNFYKVKKGDYFLINPGTIHAIGKGVRIIEIQQNSNLTYRLFDYLRKDKNGQYRQLHIDKALDVINFTKYEASKNNLTTLLADNEYFTVEKKDITGEVVLNADKGSFISFTFIEGNGYVDDIKYEKFDTFFLPYKATCKIKGNGTIIISKIS